MFAVICSLVVSFSLQKIITAFDGLCPLNAKLEFEAVENNLSFKNLSPNLKNDSTTNSVFVEKRFAKLSDYFEASTAKRLQRDSSQEYPIEQVKFLADCE